MQVSEHSVAPPHAPDLEDEQYPLPGFLRMSDYACTVNVGIFRPSGVGKSTLINSLRSLRPGDAGAAPVGARETTMRPAMYHYGALSAARLWDIPGAGTERFPRDTYIRDMGLRFFDIAVLVTATRVTEVDQAILHALRGFGVPCFVVRSKIDIDIRNESDDHGQHEEVTKRSILEELLGHMGGVEDAYLVSKQPDEHDLPRLRQSLLTCVLVSRSAKQADQSDCPVCRQPFTIFAGGRHSLLTCPSCGGRLCRSCAEELRSPLSGVVACPFCCCRFRGPERLPGVSTAASGIVEHAWAWLTGGPPGEQATEAPGRPPAVPAPAAAGTAAVDGARAPEEAAAPRGGLCAGALVEVHGLVGAPELNGKRGRLNGKEQGDRLGVDLEPPDGTKALRPENLRAVREEV